jgi:acyl-CoA synthetase (AMP-forming)/AMP-acid ligase II
VTWSPNFGFALAAQRIADRQLDGVRLEHVHSFWNAAERIHAETLHAFHKRFAPWGVELKNLRTNFGCAENIGGATFSDRDGAFLAECVDVASLQDRQVALPIADPAQPTAGAWIVSCGRPCPGMRIKILSADGAPLPDGHVGRIALDTPSRFDGYLKDEQQTKLAIDGDWLTTGDLGYLRGPELFWVGRTRERITVRGKKFDPSDFESVLLNIVGLRQGCFAAFGVDDTAQGTQRLVIVAEVREGNSRPTSEIGDDIRKQVFATLGISVSEVVLVEHGALAKTSSGKRRHRHFRELYLHDELAPFTVGRLEPYS